MNGSTLRAWLLWATSVVLTASVVGCGGVGGSATSAVETPSSGQSSAPSPSSAPTATTAVVSAAPTALPTPDTIAVKAYFMLQGNIEGSDELVSVNREVPPTAAVATAAMQQLLNGPTYDERAHDLRLGTIGTAVPDGTRLLGVDIENGIATVDLSGEFVPNDRLGIDIESWAFRLAQVTFTLTQFPIVDSVLFKVDGTPMTAVEGHEGSPIERATRDAYADQLPGIFVDQPAWGGALTDPLTVSGIAQIMADPPQFEAAIVDRTSDEIIVQETVRASCGTSGCWHPPGGGPFEVRLSIPAAAFRTDRLLRVWEVAAGGSQIHFLEYPLR